LKSSFEKDVRNSEFSIPLKIIAHSLEDESATVFRADLLSVNQQGLFWEAPSTFSISNTGAWEITSHRLLHFSGDGSGDTGHDFTFSVLFLCFDEPDQKGSFVHSNVYDLTRLKYKEEIFGTNNTGIDPSFIQALPKIKSASAFQTFSPFTFPLNGSTDSI